MKKYSIIFSLLLSLFALDMMAQAKKPTLMVVPSDTWCIRNGYYTESEMDGVVTKVMDYQRAFQENSDIRVIVSKMGDIMAARGFPIKSMEQEMKSLVLDKSFASSIQSNSGSMIQESQLDVLNRTAKPDIILDLDYEIKRIGAKKQISFNLTALDAYSRSVISGNTGVGSESNAPITTLLEEAVLSYMDNFTTGLQNFFDDIFANGRIVNITMKVFDGSPVDFDSEFDYNGQIASLADILYVWFEDNTVQGRFDETSRTSTEIVYNPVRMPIMGKSLSGRETAMSISNYINGLVKVLRGYNIKCKRVVKGQGSAIIVIGEDDK